MKYQTFNASCCYAGLANLLDDFSIDIEDRDIVLGAQLPYMLRFDSARNCFLAGPMLQGAEWFDLYLNPRGLRFAERSFSGEAAVNFLAGCDTRVMLAVDVPDGRQALVFDGIRGSRFHFISNKWKEADGAERYMFTAAELYDRIDPENNSLGWVELTPKKPVDFLEKLYITLEYIAKYRASLQKFCSVEREKIALRWAMEPLFRPLMVDLLSMMELAGEARLVLMIKVLRRSLSEAFNAEGDTLVPFDYISEQQLGEALDRYTEIVQTQMQRIAKGQI